MACLRWLFLLSFIESFATIIVERGIYFFAREHLAFTDTANLLLALLLGGVYVVGALSSHRLAHRWGERRMLGLCFLGQMSAHVLIAVWATPATLFIGVAMVAWWTGVKWPIIESYVAAGRDSHRVARSIGWFNLSWAAPVPLSLAATGPILSVWPIGLLWLAALINVGALAILTTFPPHPAHTPDDHPSRPDPATLQRMSRLLNSSRWSMLSSYGMLFLIAPIIPGIFERLGHSIALATSLSAVLDAVRVTMFFTLQRWTAWRGRAWPLVLVIFGLPLGFVMIVSEASTAMVIAGEIVFGVFAGMTYYASLYYALVVKNASVDAGGAHEGLIGLGFFLGPLAGLLGTHLTFVAGSAAAGAVLGIAPLAGLCGLVAGRTLANHRHASSHSP